MSSERVIILLCGIPASGKTSFSRALAASLAASSFVVHLVCYDDFYVAAQPSFDHEKWKQSRTAAESLVCQHLGYFFLF